MSSQRADYEGLRGEDFVGFLGFRVQGFLFGLT